MVSQRIFLVLVILLIAGGSLWYMFVYQPQENQITQQKLAYAHLTSKFSQAQMAEHELSEIKKNLDEIKNEVSELKLKFVDKKQLTSVMNSLKEVATKNKVELIDFEPVLDSYFENDSEGNISPLPINVTVRGMYVEIGRFIEQCSELDFYIAPGSCTFKQITQDEELLESTISMNLYTWEN